MESYYLLFFPNKDSKRLVRILLVSPKNTYALIHRYQAGFVTQRLNTEHLPLHHIYQCNGPLEHEALKQAQRTQLTAVSTSCALEQGVCHDLFLLTFLYYPFLPLPPEKIPLTFKNINFSSV